MLKNFFVQVNFNNEKVSGLVKIKDYIKAVRSMRHSDCGDWLYVPVWSGRFKGYADFICYFPINEIKIIKVKRGDK